MKGRLLGLAALILFCCVAVEAQPDENTVLTETGYQVIPSSSGYKIRVVVVAENPAVDKFASYPNVRVTLRAADGSVLTTREIHSAGIPPKHKIAFSDDLSADERPAKVEFRPLSARYEATEFRPSDFRDFEVVGVRSRLGGNGRVRITGEIKNPYPSETGAWITFLFRDKSGKLIGGHSYYASTVPAGDPTPFEIQLSAEEIPEGISVIEKVAFSHNNYQSSWRKNLKR